MGRQGEPGRDVLRGRPSAHVGADLREEAEGVVGADPVDLGQVDPGEVVPRRAKTEAGLVLARLRRRRAGGRGVAGAGTAGLRASRVRWASMAASQAVSCR